MPSLPLNAIATISRPRWAVDSQPPSRLEWGWSLFPLGPGFHRLRCYLIVLGRGRWGDATDRVRIPEGPVVRLRWSPHALEPGPNSGPLGRADAEP